MKRIIKSIVIILLLLLTACGNASEEKAKKMLATHLKERYGEEFDIRWGGRDGYSTPSKKVAWFQFDIVPESYLGTNKLYDKYYDCYGTVMIRKKLFGEKLETPRDTYSNVLLKEQANEFYVKKLKELFGENVLPVLEVTGSFSVKNKSFLENVELTEKRRKENNNTPLYIEGGIYIFGRVENDADREWYRKQIYEFVQFMKQTGTFEYVAMQIKILDERCLTDYFDRNKLELLEAKQKYTTSKDYLEFREKFFKKCNNEYEQMTQEEKNIKMDSFNKGEFNDYGTNTYFSLYHMGLTSPKFKDSEPRDKSRRKEYNSIADVQLLNSVKIMYEEYYRADNGDIIEK
ncbi:hypothetical protein [Fusobacterium sp. SYSU M8D902]|uniref:hypothetical protein n=1 Tax=Fusobacterium sp. SYSU M8D902 TaxID=3159562 RepID=UPI0032E43207